MFANLYHAHHARQMEDLPLWVEQARQAGGPVLELGCGTGRLSIPLAGEGFELTGVDIDRSMLDVLRAGANAGNIRLVQADFRALPLCGGYRLIFLPCNTYSSLDGTGRVETLRSARRVLDQGGRFAVSIPNPDILRSLPRHSDLEEEDEFYLEDGSAVIVSSGWDRTKDNLTFHWVYDRMSPDGGVMRYEAEARHYLTPLEKLIGELREEFTQVDVFGGYDRYELVGESEVLVVVAS